MTIDNVLLPKCEFCGKLNCIAHKKYTDRCVDCGKRYARYSSYKSLQSSSFTTRRMRLLEGIIAEYIALRDAGYKVPRDLQIKRT